LPIGKGRALNLNGLADAALGGWTINGVYYRSTGIPINSPVVGAPVSYFSQRPNMNCDPSKSAPHTAAQWFTASCFTQPSDNQSPFIAGNAPAYLDHVRTMGANDLDITLSKTFKLGKERDIRFDVSAFNVANKAQFAPPSVVSEYPLICSATHPNCGTAGDPTAPSVPYSSTPFGQIAATSNAPRQFQFGSRFTF
jgi:hypothetical protein